MASRVQQLLPLSGKHAFITGGSGGIGCACAKKLLIDGANVTLMARNNDSLNAAKKELMEDIPTGTHVHTIAADSCNETELKDALDASHKRFGCLDIAIATVGGGAIRPLLLHDEKSFNQELQLNIVSAFLLIPYATPLMVKTASPEQLGSIVCISSDAAKLVFPWLPAYTTAKSGLEGLVKACAEELSSLNIRVNAVRPGLTRTKATQALFDNTEIKKKFAQEKPLGRLGEPDDVAAGVRYLAGPESSWVTGQSFAIEGGNELRKGPDMAEMVKQIYGDEAFEKVRAGIAPFD